MRILLIGAYGFIGSEIARDLIRQGHHVLGAGRDIAYGSRILPQIEWHRHDLNDMRSADAWRGLIGTVDAVVNASGLLQTGAGADVRSVQVWAIKALVEAAEGVPLHRFVQISAAGVRSDSSTEFMRTKFEADEAIRRSSLPWVILRPGLVVGRNAYGGTDLIRSLATVPFLLRLGFEKPIACVAMDDVIAAVAVALHDPGATGTVVDLVEEDSRSLEAIIAAHRQWLGFGVPRHQLAVPKFAVWLTALLADAFGWLGWRFALRSTAVTSLSEGVAGDASQTREFLGRRPLSLQQALANSPAGKQDRIAARIFLLTPAMAAALFLMWLLSGVLALAQPAAAEATLLAQGIDEALARSVACIGGITDMLLALGLLWRRTARAALIGMMFVTILYLIGGSILLPGLWLDPFAPLAKAIPAAFLALVTFWAIERR